MFRALFLASLFWNLAINYPVFAESGTLWEKTDYSHLGASSYNNQDYILFDKIVCNNDNLGSLLCFDYGWRNACLGEFRPKHPPVGFGKPCDKSPDCFAGPRVMDLGCHI